ncbi:MAG: mevalonate kinase [Planctomycetota bacterium]|jgi:mevalonate kinase
MRSAHGSAPAKAILIGEHAVVYGRPAIAVPVTHLLARATLEVRNDRGLGIFVHAPDLGLKGYFGEGEALNPLAAGVETAYDRFDLPVPPLTLRIESDIPVARGLGSGAAVAVATVRACSALENIVFGPDDVSSMAFEVEKIHHGTPSGIDNTVVALEKPVLFDSREGPTPLNSAVFSLVLADSGTPSSTSEMVSALAARLSANPVDVNKHFDEIGSCTLRSAAAMAGGSIRDLGRAMSDAHTHLRGLGLSTPRLDDLVDAALKGGAAGAKLSGAGGGGFMIALVDPEVAGSVEEALSRAGANTVFRTKVGA